MAPEQLSVDVTHLPDLRTLAEEVRKTKRPRVLQADGTAIALIVPATAEAAEEASPRPREQVARPKEKYPTIAALAGAASTLPTPNVSWEEIRESSREERLATKLGLPDS